MAISGPKGTSVVRSGSSFNLSAAQNIVYFGAFQATVTATSATSLTVAVPLGATYKSFTVLNLSNRLVGSNVAPLKVTYKVGIITSNNFPSKIDFIASTETLNMAMGDLGGDGKSD